MPGTLPGTLSCCYGLMVAQKIARHLQQVVSNIRINVAVEAIQDVFGVANNDKDYGGVFLIDAEYCSSLLGFDE